VVGVTRTALALVCLACLAPAAHGLQVWDRVVLNEVFYYPMGYDSRNEYLELLNAGGTVAFLDGAVITDEGDEGMPEGVYKFPGRYGGHSIPLHPGGIVLIAVDAVDDEIWPDLAHADWEFWHEADDNDNPDVPNITLVSGSNCDMALANAGDGVLIATGVDTTAAIDCWTVVDGVNWGRVMDEVPIAWTVCTDPEYAHGCPQGNSIARCPGGVDHDTSSAADWFMSMPTPGEPNVPSYASDCSTVVRAVSWGVVKALYR
jgi:hypothetical protein